MDRPAPRFSPVLFSLSAAALLWSTVILFAGGFTTSIGAGMAFLDWPLSNGSLNPAGWTEQPDQLAEHSHRLAAKVLGLVSIVIAVAFWLREPREPVRWLAVGLFFIVLSQGILGGLRVLLDQLNTGWDGNTVARGFAVAHAMGAQLVVLTLTTLTVVSSPGWFRRGFREPGGFNRRHADACQWSGYIGLALLSVAILFGAITRHTGAALAIQTFPAATAEGSWWPDSGLFSVWVHYLHRTLGMIGGLAVLVFAALAWAIPGPRGRAWLSLLPAGFVGVQIWLGLLILETMRNPHVATLHMLNGALILGSLWAAICWGWASSRKAESTRRHANANEDCTDLAYRI